MATPPEPTDSDFDIEAQCAILQSPLVPGQSQIKSNATQESWPTSTGDQNSGVTSKAQYVIPEDEGTQTSGVNIHNDEGNNGTTMQGQDQTQTELETTIITIIEAHANDPALQEPQDREEVPSMPCDFEGSANALWTIYGKEAKSHDEARIQTLKDDMDGVLIFAGLFSAVLAAFALDSKQNLKPSPSDQMVYYLQQNVAMLDQISHQSSFLAPQVSIPSTPPSPFPAFNPLASDICVNVFGFMALIFSLTAALLAILVQQWVRAYMQAFTRKVMKDGTCLVIAEAVPGLLHVSLFLFFVGLCDSILKINTAVGVSTTVPIGITGLAYIFAMIAPVIYLQSPYRNSFSSLIWYLTQKLHGRRFRDRDSNGTLKTLSSDMAQGQMELAMEETEARKGRDERSIRWLVGNTTEDAEIESLVKAIPGSFNGEWGLEVWKKILNSRSNHEPVAGPIADSDVVATNPPIVRPSRVNAGLEHL
ncbi:hypothetical protein BC827DRAFT_1270620 [Russula dissimulans]|nr:hypothetical protein BC827DRAFT_1270620 [Russula dissimulans]